MRIIQLIRAVCLLLFSLVFLISPQTGLQAQVAATKTITGIVTDGKGVPLPGVNITIKGRNSGVVSDSLGSFSITASSSSVLVFSFVGSAPKEVVVGNQSVLSIQLETDNQSLSDVVVVGYGTQKKVNVIGSVVTVSSKDISAAPVSNVSNALAGRLPGAVIQQSGGEPGNDAATITIRGMATLGNNQPLVVIDGILGRDMNALNPSDIESVSILKDASAAIYGARAANGVILITTKRGRSGSPLNLGYNFYTGWLSPTALPKMADAPSYASMIREMQSYMGVDPANMKFSETDVEKFSSGRFPWTHPNTNWIDAAFAKYTNSSNHNVTLNGGSQALNYYVSFGTQHDNGIFKQSSIDFRRFNVKSTIDAKINEYLTLGLDLNATQENKNYPSTSTSFNLDGAIKSLPTSPAFYPNGLPGPDIAYGQNPVVSATDQTGFDKTTNYRLNTIFSANLKIPYVKGLNLSSYYAYDVLTGNRKWFQKPWTLYQLDEPAYLAAGNTGVEDGSAFLVGTLKGVSEPSLRNYANDYKTKTFNLKLDYTTSFGKGHNLSAFAALETAEYEGRGIEAFRRYFISDQLPYLFAGGDAEKDNGEFVTLDSRVNYFGRISYNYQEKYLFQFSMRRDGSLRFSEESGRWGNFPSVLAGWRLSSEPFWKKHLKFIDFFKLKASWGQMGNDLVLPFQYLPLYSISTGYTLGSGRTYYTGLSQLGAVNPNITWEVANVYNVGFESNWFNSRLTFNADFFYQRRKNILVKRNASVPDFTGIQLPDENFGIVDNRGFELALGYHDRAGDFTYSVNGNFAFARNKIIEFDEPAKIVPWQTLTGKPQGSTLVYHAIGIFRNEDEINKTPHVDGAIPGDIIIEDVNNDGVIDSKDQILNTKTVNPEITYGLSFNLGYRNFSLNGLIQGAAGSSRLVMVELQGLAGNYFAYDAEGRWTPNNPNASKPRAFERNSAYWRNDYKTDYNYQKGDYARLKNLQLVYTVPANVYSKVKLKGAQVYVSGQNLFLIYNRNKYLDPEVGGIKTNSTDAANTGMYNYPIMRVYSIGARIDL